MMKRIILIFIGMLFIGGLANATTKNTSVKEVKILRLDKELYDYLSKPNSETENRLLKKYSNLLPALTQTITGQNTTDLTLLKNYFEHPDLNTIYKYTVEHFDDLSVYESEIQDAVSNIQSKLTTRNTPTFAVHVSGFKENVIYTNNTISLSLDKYLGSNNKFYNKYFTATQQAEMDSRFIVRDFIKAWLMADYIKTETTEGNLLFEVIEHGKLLFALKTILPQISNRDLMGYTPQEYDFCLHTEKAVWDSLLKNKLYSKDKQDINVLFDSHKDYTPNNTALTTPRNMGSWIGYQIVSKYATETKSTLKELLSVDEKTILKKSKYNPQKQTK